MNRSTYILSTARTLIVQAEDCVSADATTSDAGLIALQDAIGLVFYASQLERDDQDSWDIRSLDYEKAILEMRSADFKKPMSRTMKVMNTLRNAAQAYGKLMLPTTVKSHLNAAKLALDSILNDASLT